MRSRSRTKSNRTIWIAGILLCLVLVSAHFTSGFYARYRTDSNGGATAEAASFNVTAAGPDEDAVKVSPGWTTGTFAVTLNNRGQTAVGYSARLVCANEEDEALLSEGWDTPLTGTLAVGETKEIALTIGLKSGAGTADMNDSDFSNDTVSGISGELPFTVNVIFTQLN